MVGVENISVSGCSQLHQRQSALPPWRFKSLGFRSSEHVMPTNSNRFQFPIQVNPNTCERIQGHDSTKQWVLKEQNNKIVTTSTKHHFAVFFTSLGVWEVIQSNQRSRQQSKSKECNQETNDVLQSEIKTLQKVSASGQCQVSLWSMPSSSSDLQQSQKAAASPPSQPAISRLVSSCIMRQQKCNSCIHQDTSVCMYTNIQSSNFCEYCGIKIVPTCKPKVPDHVSGPRKRLSGKKVL